MQDFSLEDIVAFYVDDHYSIGDIQCMLSNHPSRSTVYNLLRQDPRARKLLNQRHHKHTNLDPYDAYVAYLTTRSLRKAAQQLGVSTTTVRRYVLKYQKAHPTLEQAYQQNENKSLALRQWHKQRKENEMINHDDRD